MIPILRPRRQKFTNRVRVGVMSLSTSTKGTAGSVCAAGPITAKGKRCTTPQLPQRLELMEVMEVMELEENPLYHDKDYATRWHKWEFV